MPPTSEAGGPPTVLIHGLDEFELSILEPDVDAAARAALTAQSRVPASDAEISVAFVADDEISALNEEWLGQAGPTDVISFPLGDDPLVADIYVGVETATRNAARFGVDRREELLRLVVHGVLHAAGFEHPDGEERANSEMYALQEGVVDRLLGRRPET